MGYPSVGKSIVRRFILLTACLATIVGCEPPEENPIVKASKPPLTLTIISPHGERIRQTFAEAFSNWYKEKYDRLVRIEWIVRGTPQCVEYIDDLFAGRGFNRGFKTPDLMFGGGTTYHASLAEHGRCFELELGEALTGMPADVHGLPTRDAKNRWVATGLSSFGILYNAADAAARKIEAPKTWSDLADPQYSGWLAIADPATSGSYRQCMMLILQQQGWNDGWGTLVRILANARALESGSVRAHNQIESGAMLAGFAVNFDGLRRAQENPKTLLYINPTGATAVTPDIVSVLKTAADSRLAQQFVRFCLSDIGQATWSAMAKGSESGEHTLYHYPIKPGIYETHKGKMAVEDNPFETDFGIQIDPELAVKQSAALVPLIHAVCGENHILLQQAWAAIQSAGMNAEALAELCSPIVDEQEAYKTAALLHDADPTKTSEIHREWSDAVRKKLERVVELAQG